MGEMYVRSSGHSSSLCIHSKVLSIDIDGADYWLWRSLKDTAFRPRVVIVEFNPTIPNNIEFVQVLSAQHAHAHVSS